MTPQDALELARQYVAEHRSYCRVSELLEDADDYLVCTESDGPFPGGPGPILISKAAGEVWTLGSAEGGNPRWDNMRPVQGLTYRQSVGPVVGEPGGNVLDSKHLGRLRRVADPREVWLSEAADFTPWLAENIDVLAEELGMTLTVIQTEVPVGGFRLDIQAEDGDGRTVIIENQLERTDHSHLGQCLVYAAGLEAATVIWVSRAFRDEFRRTLDWLNERTDTGVQFFGVEVGVVQIGEAGPRAPVFDVVSRPNDWQKQVKGSGGIAAGSAAVASPANEARQDFYGAVLERLIAERPSIRMPKRPRENWISFGSGPFGYWALSNTADGRLRVEAYLDCGDKERNKALFDQIQADPVLGAAAQTDLAFERLDEKRASRIAAYFPFDAAKDDDGAQRTAALEWASEQLGGMYDRFNETLRTRAKQLRSGASLGASSPEPPAL